MKFQFFTIAALALGVQAFGQRTGMWDDLVRDSGSLEADSKSAPEPLPVSNQTYSVGRSAGNTVTVIESSERTSFDEPELLPPSSEVEPLDSAPLLPNDDLPSQPIDVEKPATNLFVVDPRSDVAREQFTGSPFEPTSLTVNRVVTIGGVDPGDPTNTPKWKVREPLNIPVIYNTRTLRLTEDAMKKASAVVDKLASISKRSVELQDEAEKALEEWNDIVRSGTPEPVLYADSPSLPENQSGSEVNRGEPRPGFEPGEGISFQLQ